MRRGELVEQLRDVREGTNRLSERIGQAQHNHAYFQVRIRVVFGLC